MIPDIETKDIEVKLLKDLPDTGVEVVVTENHRCTYKQIQAEFRHGSD